MRVFLQALGCRLNEAELESWSQHCQQRGYALTEDPARADLVVINTCAVTGESVRKSRQLVRRAHRANPHAKLVVSGCYATLQPEQAAAEMGVDLVVANADKDRLISLAVERLDLPVMPQIATEPGENALLSRGRHRAFIKVQDGCRYRCAFCIVTQARGAERSRPSNELIAEIRQLQLDGVQEVVLAGVHLGGYGSDIDSSLAALVRAVLDQTEIPRLRLGSLEPWELGSDFWQLFDNPRLMPHLHLPMQSGADSVLRRMSRRCRVAEFEQLLEQARDTAPGFNVTTDIIVGFPGESDDEWRQTVDFVERSGFGHVHIFAYSPRSGTKAASMPDQVPNEVKRARTRELHEVAAVSRRQMLERHRQHRYPVLLESTAGTARTTAGWIGYTPNYLRVLVKDEAAALSANSIVEVATQAVDASGEMLIAEPLDRLQVADS